MVKKVVLFFAMLLSFSAFAVNIGVATFVTYDGEGTKISLESVPSESVYKNLTECWADGLINFDKLSSKKTGDVYTVLDAYKVCTAESLDYIIYGFIEKRDDNYFANLKLYSAADKKNIKLFYSSDDYEHYDRFIKVLSQNVLDGIEEITGIDKLKEKQDKYRNFEIKIPLSLFYWSPMENGWNERVMGLGGANTGLEIYPPLPLKVTNSRLIDVSIKLNADWSYGMNQPGYYALNLNNITVTLPVIVHIHYNPKISSYMGCGFGYGIDMVLMTPKYEEEKFFVQNVFVFEALAGCEFNINKLIDLFVEADLDIQFKENAYFKLRPKLGMSFKFGGEK